MSAACASTLKVCAKIGTKDGQRLELVAGLCGWKKKGPFRGCSNRQRKQNQTQG